MCGIYGYVGHRNGIKIALEGLKRIEYRGYDSTGLAAEENGKLLWFKEVGKVSNLEKVVGDSFSPTVIAHTRWATHGIVTRENAHPQLDMLEQVAVVHNGIIENHDILRKKLKQEGVTFSTELDSEVIPQLIARFYEGDFLKSVQQAIVLLSGAYAFLAIHRNHPGEIIAAANGGPPLVLGIGAHETFIASDSNALLHHTRDVVYLADGEVAQIKADSFQIYDASMVQVSKKTEQLLHSVEVATKGEYAHFTLKEIFEQPKTLYNAIVERFYEAYGQITLDGLKFSDEELLNIKKILIVACGTSYHAGLISAVFLEDKVRIPTQVEISSEFRYRNPIVQEGTLVIAISQSGETADTLAAVRELKAKGAKILAVCNVHGSSLAREADSCVFLRAGPEVGVCSTKAFTSNLMVLSLFGLHMARLRLMSKTEGQEFLQALYRIPEQVQLILEQAEHIKKLAAKYYTYDHFFFLGRRYMYPTSMEGALKLKEIAYIDANAYPAGEMKHGPIALINENCPTVASCADTLTFEKLLSNLMEVKSRRGKIIAVAKRGSHGLENIADDILYIPESPDEFAPVLCSVVLQLFAYHMAVLRGAEIDNPRNLAKSVTVE